MDIHTTQPNVRLPYHLSSGTMVAVIDDGGVALVTSPDGTTWGSPAPLSGAPTWTNLLAVDCIADTLYLWWANGTSWGITSYPLSSSGAPGTTTTVRPTLSYGAYTAISPLTASYDGSTWHLLSAAQSNASPRLLLTALSATGTIIAQQPVLPSALTLAPVILVTRGQKLFVVGKNAGVLQVFPLVYLAGTYSASAIPELSRIEGSDIDMNGTIDQTGALDLLIREGDALVAIKRTGSGQYSTARTLDTGVVGIPMTTQNQTTGDLFVAYQSTKTFPTGEVMVAPRIAGAWYPSVVALGGDARGYRYPNTGRTPRGSIIDLLAEQGTGTNDTFLYDPYDTATPPGTPVPSTPSGVVGSPITYRWQYVNPMLSNPQGAYRLLITLQSDGSTVEDSAWVTSSTTQATPAWTLPTSVPLNWQVQTKDAISGTASPLSSPIGFTLQDLPLPLLAAVDDGSGLLGSSTSEPSFVATLEHHQSDGHGMSAARLALFPYPLPRSMDGTTTGALVVGPQQSYSPYKGEGDRVSLTLDATGLLQNGHSYALVGFDTDAVSGAVGTTAPVTFTLNAAALSGITNLQAAMDPTAGLMTLTWQNPAGTVGNRIRTSRAGKGDWKVKYDGPAIESFALHVPPIVAHDYEVMARNSAGVLSS